MKDLRVAVVTVVYGGRWHLLKQVAEACLDDARIGKFIIVDNGCTDARLMDVYAAKFGDRVHILRQERNIGFSGAIEKGLAYVREVECDYVYVLDDDSVPERGFVDFFISNLKLFNDGKTILVSNRIDIPGNEGVFRKRPLWDHRPRGTIFEVFSFKKMYLAVKLFFGIEPQNKNTFLPIVPTEAFVTGGSFLPIAAVREAPLPDGSLFIYGEDLEYSWRIIRMGYKPYLVSRPTISDIDITFPEYGSHIWGLFDKKTPNYKVYFRMRNAVIISKRNTEQYQIILFLNIIGWFVGLSIFSFFKVGPSRTYFVRLFLVARALTAGYFKRMDIPKDVITPG